MVRVQISLKLLMVYMCIIVKHIQWLFPLGYSTHHRSIEERRSSSSISGGLSQALCEVKNENQGLWYLKLRENSLSGEIPECWMNYPELFHIDLNSNNFTGSIPRSLFHLEGLEYLGLGNNSLTGPITFDFVNHE
ncbi:unnamed protein product [Coffea canephora]|uniref:Leucine-rich repeat-containing N-terminal plant-type domain-containing protein n=1 Tax=Coffea canephora TaxID=49390 RepID=A0A068UJ67_COFCA|nr:unnamed protein product [Coffea canephora]